MREYPKIAIFAKKYGTVFEKKHKYIYNYCSFQVLITIAFLNFIVFKNCQSSRPLIDKSPSGKVPPAQNCRTNLPPPQKKSCILREMNVTLIKGILNVEGRFIREKIRKSNDFKTKTIGSL